MLLERADAAGETDARALLEAMEAEHEQIDPALAACADGFAAMAGTRAPTTATRSTST